MSSSYQNVVKSIPVVTPLVRDFVVMPNMQNAIPLVEHINQELHEVSSVTRQPNGVLLQINIENYSIPTEVLSAVIEDYRLAGYKVQCQIAQKSHERQLVLSK